MYRQSQEGERTRHHVCCQSHCRSREGQTLAAERFIGHGRPSLGTIRIGRLVRRFTLLAMSYRRIFKLAGAQFIRRMALSGTGGQV